MDCGREVLAAAVVAEARQMFLRGNRGGVQISGQAKDKCVTHSSPTASTAST
jgi:hypothetical protein